MERGGKIAVFMIAATAVNLLIVLTTLVVLILVLNLILSGINTESMAPQMITGIYALAFILSLVGAFFIYHKLLKWAMKKWDLSFLEKRR